MSHMLVFSTAERGADASAFICTRRGPGRDAAWVRVEGELDIATAPRLERTLRRAERRARLVVLDLRELTFIDCSGVYRIADAAIRARRACRRLILVRGPSQVDRLLVLTGVSDFIEIRDLNPGEPVVQVLLQLAHEEQAASNLPRPPRHGQDRFEDDLGPCGSSVARRGATVTAGGAGEARWRRSGCPSNAGPGHQPLGGGSDRTNDELGATIARLADRRVTG